MRTSIVSADETGARHISICEDEKPVEHWVETRDPITDEVTRELIWEKATPPPAAPPEPDLELDE